MAIEAERLLAIFEARFTSLEKALVKAKAQSKDSFGSIEADGTRAENALATIGARGTPNIDKATKATKAFKVETGNLAAQFNDIGVQLAGGQSPFLIALQQGTQITQALGPSGARAAVTALGGAFMSLLNPVGLATIAIIAGGGYAAQYFLNVVSGGEKSAETLKREAELIQRVADKWGVALPALQAYADEQERLAGQQDRIAALTAAIENVGAPLVASLSQVEAAVAATQEALIIMGDLKAANDLKAQFEALQKQVADGTITQTEFNRELALLGQLAVTAGRDGQELIDLLNSIAVSGGNAAAAMERLSKERINLQRQDIPTSLAGPAYTDGVILPDNAPTPDRAPNREDVGAEQDRYAARQARSTRQRADDYERLTDRTVKQTAAMVAETEAQRQLNPAIDDYGYAADKARMEQELLTAAQDAGKKITPELRGEIALLADQYATASVEARQLAESQRDQARAAADAARFQKDLSRSIVDGFLEGKKASDILADSLKKLGDRLLDLAFDQAFDGKSGGGILGILGNLLGLGGSSGGGSSISWLDDLFRASGGPVRKGQPYVVGDKNGLQNAELFVPDQNGTILPSVPKISAMAAPASGAGSVIVNFAPQIDNRGASVEAVARTQQQLDKLKAELPAHVTAAIRKAQKSNVKLS